MKPSHACTLIREINQLHRPCSAILYVWAKSILSNMWKDVEDFSFYSWLFIIQNTQAGHTKNHGGTSSASMQRLLFSFSFSRQNWRVWICLYKTRFTFMYLHLHTFRFKWEHDVVCTVHRWKSGSGEGGKSLETCQCVPLYEATTGETHPSTSKFITVHHLPTCRVMTFSQFYKKLGNL